MEDIMHMDETNRKGVEFMEDPDSFTPEATFDLFCEVFDVTETDAAAFFNGYRFDLED